MGQLAVRIINIVLFTSSCFFAAGVVNHIADSQLAPDYVAAFQPVARPEAQQPSWNERSDILSRNLFGAEVGSTASVPEVAPAPEPEEEAQATKLPIELLGTLAGEPDSLSTAVINNTRKKKHQVVRIGDTLKDFDYVMVIAIEPRRVVLKNRNVVEELLLSKVSKGSNARSSPRLASSASRRPHKPSALDRIRDRKSRSKARRERSRESRRRGDLKSDENIEAQLRKMQGAVTQDLIRDLEPAFNEAGEIHGVLVGKIAEDALLAKAGLEENDVIVSLNGIEIESAGAAARVLRELAKCKPMTGVVQNAAGERTINITQTLLAELNCTN